jgi:hypothetical protein
MSMGIYIPSKGRWGQIVQEKTFPNECFQKYPLHIVVHNSEYEKYKNKSTYPTRIVDCPITGIGSVRQWCLQHAQAAGYDVCLMMDDDIHFDIRREDEPTKFAAIPRGNHITLLDDLHTILKHYAHGGVASRQGANRNTENVLYNTRLLRVLGYNVKMYYDSKAQYDRLPVMEDFDVTLQLLRAGYDNFLINNYVQDQTQSNAPGGCSTYRTMEMQAEAAHKLAALHPGFVTVVKKAAKGGGPWAERTDVIIHWKKARKSHDNRGD